MKRFIFSLVILIFSVAGCLPPPHPPQGIDLSGADAAFHEGRYHEAVRVYQAYLTQNPQGPRLPEVYLNLGEAYYFLREPRKAQEVLSGLVSSYPGSEQAAQGTLLSARIAFEGGDESEALALLRILGREKHGREVTAGSYLLKGEIFLQRDDAGLALSQFKKGLLIAGGDKEQLSFYRKIVAAMERSASDELLDRLIRETPKNFPGDVALFVMGKQAWQEGDYFRASKIFKEFADLFPGHPLLHDADDYIVQEGNIQTLTHVRIGCIVPRSGPLKDIGDQVLQGVRLSVDRFNAMLGEEKVELVFKDSRGDAAMAKADMADLVADPRVLAVIGPVTSRSVVESAMTAEDGKLPLITPTAAAEGIGELGHYIFRNAMTSEAQAKTIAQYAVDQLGLHSFAVLYPDDYYGKELTDHFTDEIEELGGEVLCRVPYKRGSVDFGPEIRQIVQADIQGILSRNADMIDMTQYSMEEWKDNYYPSFDALYLPGYAEDVGLIAPQLAYYNIVNVQLLGSHNWNSMELITRGERYVEGAVFTDGFFAETTHTDIAEFVQAYRHSYGEIPTLFSAQAYDAAEMILQLLLQGARSREDIERGLYSFQNYPGISGLTRVLPTGEMEKELFLIQVQDGFFRQIN